MNVIASIIASIILLGAGFLWGKYKERRKFGRNLDEYDFYPFVVTRENFGEFSLKDFRLGMHYFLKNEDHTAARQLIFIGEQNNVRTQLEPAEQKVYAKLFEKYDGKKIADDTTEYLENYVRLVRLIVKLSGQGRELRRQHAVHGLAVASRVASDQVAQIERMGGRPAS